MEVLLANVRLWITSIHTQKFNLCTLVGAIGAAITYAFGGWTAGMEALFWVMVVDYITGLMVAGIFKNSSKTKSGGLKSDVGFRGLCKKFVMWMIVAVMYRLDLVLGIQYLRDLCIIGFILNEVISITENAGLMGIKLPPVISKAIAILNEKAGSEGLTDTEDIEDIGDGGNTE